MATKYKYDKDTDYQALIDRAVGNGEYGAAAVYEQQRNAKIAGEGMSYAPTLKYAAYLPYTITPDYDGSAREQAESLIGEATQSTAQDAAVQELLDALLGAEFSYDPASDALYASYRKQYLREADLAAENALGSAAALTGGRASTAAVAASQQAGNYYRAKAADKIPELAELAWSRYRGSQDDKRATLDALLTMRENDRDAAWRRIDALLDLDESTYQRYASGMEDVRAQQEAAEATRKAQEDKAAADAEKARAEQEKVKAAAEKAAASAQADARKQIALILKNYGRVPDSLWKLSGYDAATIAAMRAGMRA